MSIGAPCLPSRVPPLLKAGYQRYGNLDPLSIAFACALRLRPDLPYADHRCVGNLRLSVSWILTRIVATHPSILSSRRSTRPYGRASLRRECSPTTHQLALMDPRLRWRA